MSLFRLVEFVSSRVENISCMTVGRISPAKDHDQVLIGTEDGTLVFVDAAPLKQQARPQSGNPTMLQDGVMLMHPVGLPVLQIAMAQFVPQYSSHTLAVLTPKMLIMYDIEKGDTDSPVLQQMYSHNLVETAFKMVSVPVIDANHHILVMGIGASMSIYDGEQCVLSRLLSTSLHPGPIGVCHSSSSIIVGSSGTVRSVKYSLLTAHSVGGKKLNFDWALAVGDSVVDIQITQNESLPTIMVLCRKRLVALTSGGNLKFSFDLQCIGLALKSFNHGPTNYIISIVSTNTGALLVLKDNILMWTSHTPFVARYLDLCDAREAICMLTVADTNQMVVGYLGTEPSLYRIPIAPNRSVDYAAKRAQMAEFEEQIRLFGGGGVDIDGDEAPRATVKELTATLDAGEFDNPTRAHSKHGDIPSWTLRLTLPPDLRDVQINVHTDLQTETKSYMIANTKDASLIPLTFFIGDVPPVDPHITVAVHHESTQLILTASLPLSLIATPCSLARQAKHKVTLDVDGPTHDLTELLPDITSSPSHTNQIGLQILTTDVVVCILTAGKSNRYRIQSDSLDYLYLVTMKLMEGIKEKNENARINVNFAVSSAVEAAENYVQLETKYEKEKEGLTKNAAEVRAMQAVLIPMTRNTKYTPLANLTLLIETTYNRLLSAIDSHAATGIRLNGLRRSLASALGVLSLSQHSLGSVAGLHFFEHTQQSLMTRLAWASKDNSGDIARMMLALLETTGPPIRSLMNIREEEEDEEEDENQDFKMGENATLGAYKEDNSLEMRYFDKRCYDKIVGTSKSSKASDDREPPAKRPPEKRVKEEEEVPLDAPSSSSLPLRHSPPHHLSSDVEILQQQVRKLEAKYKNACRVARGMELRAERAESQLDSKQGILDGSKNTDDERRKSDLIRANEELNIEMENMRRRLGSATRTIDDLARENSALRKEVDETRRQVSQIRERDDPGRSDARLDPVHIEIANANARKKWLSRENAALKKILYDMAEKERDDRESKVARLDTSVHIENELINANARKKWLSRENAALKKRLFDMAEKECNWALEILELKSELDKMKEKHDFRDRAARDLGEENFELKRELNAAKEKAYCRGIEARNIEADYCKLKQAFDGIRRSKRRENAELEEKLERTHRKDNSARRVRNTGNRLIISRAISPVRDAREYVQ